MADSRSIIALNIGSQRLTMAQLESTSKGGLVLQKYESTSILADPAAEMTRLPQIRVAINELVNKLGVSKDRVNYAISGQSVFTRFVKLPALEDDNIEQLVTFEAQQHVPFPINEVIWDWQLLNSAGGQQEVVLVAIKSDALDDLNDCVADAELITNEVDASPMALANAFKYNYGELEEPSLLIDIGARTSNLVYMDGSKIFTRTIAIGGSTITSAIAKEYQVPFIEAESQKCSNGLVSLDTRHTSGLDELSAALGTCIRTALNRMPAEIARTTNFFRSQHEGSAPKRVFLAGGGANLPKISDFFQEKLRVPVEYFNPLQRVSVGKGVDVDKVSVEAHMLGEVVGLGLRAIDKTRLKIDLVPEVVKEQRADAKRRPKVLAASAIAILASAAYCFTGFNAKAKVEDESKAAKSALAGIQKFSIPMDKQHKNAELTQEVVQMYGDAVTSRSVWLNLLNEVNEHFTTNEIWAVKFEPLVNYDPSDEEHLPYVDKGFKGVAYGETSLTPLTLEPELIKGRPNRNYKKTMINAVRVTGLRRSQTNEAINFRMDNLIKNSDYFSLEKPSKSRSGAKPKNPELYTKRELIVESETSIAEGKVAAPFTIIIPLTNPIPVK